MQDTFGFRLEIQDDAVRKTFQSSRIYQGAVQVLSSLAVCLTVAVLSRSLYHSHSSSTLSPSLASCQDRLTAFCRPARVSKDRRDDLVESGSMVCGAEGGQMCPRRGSGRL